MALTRVYLDAILGSGNCNHVKLLAYSDSGRTKLIGEKIIHLSELKESYLNESIQNRVVDNIQIIADRTYGNNPSATLANLRTAIRNWECWLNL